MILKAIIESTNLDNQYRIRIPKYHQIDGVSTATPINQLPFASVCYQPGIIPNYSIGDVVYIDFENDDLSQPIILGKLLCQRSYTETSVSDATLRSLTVQVDTQLSEDTTISDITFDDIKLAVNSTII